MFTGKSKSRRPWSTSIMTVMAVTDLLILAILEMEFFRVSQKNDFQNAAEAMAHLLNYQ